MDVRLIVVLNTSLSRLFGAQWNNFSSGFCLVHVVCCVGESMWGHLNVSEFVAGKLVGPRLTSTYATVASQTPKWKQTVT